MFVLADGRVVKVGQVPPGQDDSGPPKRVLEVSNPAGTAWARLPLTGSRLRMDERWRLFSLQGELFASGAVEGLSAGDGPNGVEWLNPASRQWQTLWQAEKDNDRRMYQGRLLVRTLVGTDGRHKTVILPLEGL